MSERYFEIGKPLGKRIRAASIQFGWKPAFTFEAWLDTGYSGSWFEYRFGMGLGPWTFSMDWAPLRDDPWGAAYEWRPKVALSTEPES